MTGGGPHRLPHALWHAASERYRRAGRFAWHFARGKLGMDPLFIDLLRLGLLPAHGRFLGLGCGQAVQVAVAQDPATCHRQPFPARAHLEAVGLHLFAPGNVLLEVGEGETFLIPEFHHRPARALGDAVGVEATHRPAELIEALHIGIRKQPPLVRRHVQ